MLERGAGGLAQQRLVAAPGALVGGLVVVEGVPTGAQAVALVAVDLRPHAATGGAGALAVGAARRRLAPLLAPLPATLALAGAVAASAGALLALVGAPLLAARALLLAAGALLPSAAAAGSAWNSASRARP